MPLPRGISRQNQLLGRSMTAHPPVKTSPKQPKPDETNPSRLLRPASIVATIILACLLALQQHASPPKNSEFTVLARGTAFDGVALSVVDHGVARFLRRGHFLLGAIFTDPEFRDQAAFTCFAVLQSACFFHVTPKPNNNNSAHECDAGDVKGQDSEPEPFLQLGLGVGAVPLFMHTSCPRIGRVDAVELDPAVAEMARAHFFYRGGPSLTRPVVRDAYTHLMGPAPRTRYGVIVHDLFHGSNPPLKLLSLSLLRRIKQAWLKPCGGMFVLNLVTYTGAGSGSDAAFARAMARTLHAVWSHVRCFRDMPLDLRPTDPANVACFAADGGDIRFATPPWLAQSIVETRAEDAATVARHYSEGISADFVMRHFAEWEVLLPAADGEKEAAAEAASDDAYRETTTTAQDDATYETQQGRGKELEPTGSGRDVEVQEGTEDGGGAILFTDSLAHSEIDEDEEVSPVLRLFAETFARVEQHVQDSVRPLLPDEAWRE